MTWTRLSAPTALKSAFDSIGGAKFLRQQECSSSDDTCNLSNMSDTAMGSFYLALTAKLCGANKGWCSEGTSPSAGKRFLYGLALSGGVAIGGGGGGGKGGKGGTGASDEGIPEGSPEGLEALRRFRGALNLGPHQGEGDRTLSKLDVGNKTFWGMSGLKLKITMRVNATSYTHAETNVLQQALNAGVSGPGTLYIDHPDGMCDACGLRGMVKSMGQQAGLTSLTVVSPQGVQVLY